MCHHQGSFYLVDPFSLSVWKDRDIDHDKTHISKLKNNYLQAESPTPRQSHSLVNSMKPGALVSPPPVQTGNRKTVINKYRLCMTFWLKWRVMNQGSETFFKAKFKHFSSILRWIFKIFQHLTAVENYIFIYSTNCIYSIVIISLFHHVKSDNRNNQNCVSWQHN